MSIKHFKYYLHDNYEGSEREDCIEEQVGELSEEVKQAIGRPFYEIELNCTIDTETGQVEILGVRG